MNVILDDFVDYLDKSCDVGLRAMPNMPKNLVAELILINREHEELYGTPVVELDQIPEDVMKCSRKLADEMLAEYDEDPEEKE